jgi:UDP-glucose 4-epimerase
MRALVTGGAGFIGSNLVDALLDRGHEVSVLDDLSSGRPANLADAARRGAAFHQADVTEPTQVDEVFGLSRPDTVFHLAAQIDVRRAVADPVFDARVNVGGTAAVLEAARHHGARRVLFASTGGALYGDAVEVPTPEAAPILPMAPYGTSKACAETYLALYERLYGLSTCALRFGNVYGPRQDPAGEAGVIAIFCGAAVDRRPVTIFGDGTQTRDYIYVGDVVDAVLAVADTEERGALNLGTGVETSVLDLADALGLEAVFAPARTGEVERSCLDPTRIAERVGWRAKVSLREGLDRTLEAARVESTR